MLAEYKQCMIKTTDIESDEHSYTLCSYWDLAVTVICDGKGKHVSKMMYSCIHKFIMISFIGWFW